MDKAKTKQAQTKELEQRLTSQTKTIREYLKSDLRYNTDFLPRPFFVEITGTPDAGKSTMIEKVDDALRKLGLRVYTPNEGAREIRYIPRTTPLYNLRTGLYALEKLIDLSHSHLYDIVIFERCIFDAYCWMEYWYRKNMLNATMRNHYQSFFLHCLHSQLIDVACIVTCDVSVAIKRNLENAALDIFGETSNPQSVEKLVNIFTESYINLSPRYPQLRHFDTTHIDQKAMVTIATTHILEMLEQKTKLK